MKKPQLLILVLVLLSALLVPVVYRNGPGTITSPKPQPQTSESPLVNTDPGGKSSPSPGGPADGGEKAALPDEEPDSQSGSSTGNNKPDAPETEPGDTAQPSAGTMVAVAVVGKNGELLFGPADVKPGSDKPVNALSVLAATGLPYVISPRFPDLVIAVAGQENQGQSGWMYKVNNQIPGVAASKKTVATGDRIIWWYSKSLDAPSPEWESLSR